MPPKPAVEDDDDNIEITPENLGYKVRPDGTKVGPEAASLSPRPTSPAAE